MKPQPTRTLNQLPFQDLEVRRFEDLVRQLAYDFRMWNKLEATGRGGADDGMDIRAFERAPEDDAVPSTLEDDLDELPIVSYDERLWIFQCKREKSIGPKQLKRYVSESLDGGVTPHGFIIAAACDFSKKARDAFRDEMVTRRVQEFALWGKAELEDMLFQPKNDGLLFAYFGISLQPRRRSLRTELRSVIAAKRQFHTLFKSAYETRDRPICLLRDPTDDRYPDETAERKRWWLCCIVGEDTPQGFMVIWKQHPAWISRDGTRWDAIESVDTEPSRARAEMEARRPEWFEGPRQEDSSLLAACDFWREHVDESQQATLCRFRVVPWERVLALDPHGDNRYPVPHVLTEFTPDGSPYGDRIWDHLVRNDSGFGSPPLRPTPQSRVAFFPVPIPKSPFPPPAQIARPLSPDAGPLSDQLRQELDDLLKPLKSVEDDTSTQSETQVGLQASAETRVQFRHWADNVVVPAFSSLVTHLRSAGHEAWIVPRDEHDTPSERSAGRIGLEIRLRDPRDYNPRYYRQGRLVYYGDHQGKVTVQVSPSPMTGGRYDPPRASEPMASLTRDRVQADLLAVVKRLAAERWP